MPINVKCSCIDQEYKNILSALLNKEINFIQQDSLAGSKRDKKIIEGHIKKLENIRGELNNIKDC